MDAMELAWKVSKPWMRVTAGLIVFLVLWVLASLVVQPDKAPPLATVQATEQVPDPAERAINNCRGAIEGIATNPSSISYHSFTAPPNAKAMTDGRLQVFVKFSARNAYGSESVSIARCVMSGDGSTLSEITTQDSR
jgi:hypothetical protein